MAAIIGKQAKKIKYDLIAKRADGTGRMVYASSNDREKLQRIADARSNERTTFTVEVSEQYK